jgi:hypothetical protein
MAGAPRASSFASESVPRIRRYATIASANQMTVKSCWGPANVLRVERRHELVVPETVLVPGLDPLTQGNVSRVLRLLELIKVIHGDEHRCRFPLIGQHDALVAAPSKID